MANLPTAVPDQRRNFEVRGRANEYAATEQATGARFYFATPHLPGNAAPTKTPTA